MPQIINTNIMSLNSQRNLNTSQSAMQTSLQRLSSGLRINSAKDDAAGLAISERFTAQIRGLNQAVRNANDGISLSQTGEGALNEYGNMLQRVRELSVQSANDTNSSSDRDALNNEVSQLLSEMMRIANATDFNGQKILDGSLDSLSFQVGANRGQTIEVSGTDARTSQLGAAVNEGVAIKEGSLTASIGNLTLQSKTIDLSSARSIGEVLTLINGQTGETGVTAKQATSVVDAATGTYTSANISTGGSVISINNIDINIASGSAIANAVTAINAETGATGVTAEANASGTQILLTGSTDITLTDSDGVLTAAVTNAAHVWNAGIELSADLGTDIVAAGSAQSAIGLSGVLTTTTTDFKLSEVKITSRTDATNAMRTLDFALQQINGFRAEFGAVQNRFESTIANLSTTAENLSASRSRIRDADFAAETAELTRTQILQQAGTAMLAQANQIPQNVLSLLR